MYNEALTQSAKNFFSVFKSRKGYFEISFERLHEIKLNKQK